MARHPAQPIERSAVGLAEPSDLRQGVDQRVADDPIVLIEELATLIKGSSVRTIRRQMRAGTFFIPELPKVDRKHRWSRARVYAAIADTTLETHRQTVLGPRMVGKHGRPAK